MNISKRTVIAGIVLLAVLWSGNIFYFKQHQLKRPLFLKHFYNLQVGMNDFELFYLQNANDTSRVSSIRFPELGDMYADFQDYGGNPGRGYYKLKQIHLNFRGFESSNMPEANKNKLITRAEIQFSNGTTENVDIGKIYLNSGSFQATYLKQTQGSSSNDNTGSASFRAENNLKLNEITCKFPELFKDVLTLNVNGADLSSVKFPMQLKSGDGLTLNYGFRFQEGDIRKNYVYRFSIDILTEDQWGNQSSSSAFINHSTLFPEEVDVQALRKEGEEK